MFKKGLLVLVSIMAFFRTNAQELSGLQLLDKAMEFHDPGNVWPTFHGRFSVTMSTPDEKKRVSDIGLNLPKEHFQLTVVKDGITLTQKIEKGECELRLNGSTEISDEDKKTHRLSCERARMMKDYYTYLYGLPMKLKDPGTIVDPKVMTRVFKGKKYHVLKVNYTEEVGKDTWYFYFDPISHALKVYQFYHDESKNDGEYILLTGEEEVAGIKMPKTRAWFYNNDDKYLGTDVLTKAPSLER